MQAMRHTTKFVKLGCILLSLVLSGCSSMQQAPGENWSMSGKIGVRSPQQNLAGFLSWEQTSQGFDVYVSGPLSQGATRIIGNSHQVKIEQNGRTMRGVDPQQLIKENLGWPFPIENLPFWLKGKTAPNRQVANIEKDGNRLSSFSQDGWQVNYLRYNAYYELPERIRISQGDWRFTIIIKNWSV